MDKIKHKLRMIFNAQRLVKLALQLLIIRFIIRMCDFEDSKKYLKEDGAWVILMLLHTTTVRLCIELFFHNYQLDNILNKTFGLIYIALSLLSVISTNEIKP